MAGVKRRRPSPALRRELEVIAELPLGDLRERWVKATDTPAPKLSAKMLRLALGYELQTKELGVLSREAQRLLDGKSVPRPASSALQLGTQLVREWQGKVHVVTVDDDGAICWNDRTWPSLSAVARAITGTRWSGPRFFGLPDRGTAA